MSSVVNKSGTRFAPKARQRRAGTSTPTPVPLPMPVQKPIITNDEALHNQEVEGEDEIPAKNSDHDNNAEPPSPKAKTVVEETSTYNKLTTKVNTFAMHLQNGDSISPSQTSTQLNQQDDAIPIPKSAVINPPTTVRSGRLASLSKTINAPLFKTDYTANTTVTDGKKERRLSTISTSLPKKIKMANAMVTENDNATLNALKRRRMSSRSSVSKKTGSQRRISVVSKINVPVGKSTSSSSSASSSKATSRATSINSSLNGVYTATPIPNPARIKVGEEEEFFQKTDALYGKYIIKNFKEIPKNIRDDDSKRYMIDEEKFTIAELCKPNLPIGEISENFEKSKMANKLKLTKRKYKREMRKRAREEFRSLRSLNKEEEEEERENRKQAAEKLLNTDVPDSYKPHTAIQLKLNPDGTLAVDEESTVVDRHKNASLENAHKQKVDENPFEKLYNSATYGRNSFTDPWTTEEIIKFYKALSMWGTDFNLIAQLFPYRTRRQIKSKFINEEKKHPIMIELALRSRLPPNFDQYCADIRRELGTVSDFNKKLEDLQLEHQENLKQIQLAKDNAKMEDSTLVKEDASNTNKKGPGGFMSNDLKVYRKTEVVLGTIDDIKRKREEEEDEGDNDSDADKHEVGHHHRINKIEMAK
ncbi:transcription factor TFIIIB subunit BDP1 NDAI_0G00620 [Naumovozyma dairenensis CBS 421]|uniref:SANT domain-containing protein n=1 Tax=Naumovozyma dairenensis (strain ATCC 10597 / BCRC 20456 / CBS 421 / NBRC 0211 / NRRL Y-12639) TaxID=1071378 RepID=G0WDH7_NAUDC|nr:hypothetical protein NDAI_0G00620 [Naumovozyma dairenensis CBS 421]CCD25838.2 hypothetical protein NDAI_0G00620 [Naumovozyma dairenensis CBS 421]